MPPYRRLVVAASVVAASVVAALTLTGCAEPRSEAASDGPISVRLYGTDGTMQDDFAAELADRSVLKGMKGTAPGSPLPAEFTNRLLEIDSSLSGFLYAGEAYDAVVISALAAELAGTPDPEVVRDYINSVTTGGQECAAVADCLELARSGEQLEYRGVSLQRGGFTDLGEPSAASYATLHFGADGFLDPGKTEYIGAGDLSDTTAADPLEPGERPDAPEWEIEPLTLGGLLPETGDLAFAYPPIIAGAQLAIEEINEAGGVFGVDVEWVDGDSGTDGEVARETLASHVEEGVHIIIGAAASGVTEAVLADAAAAKRILFSPSNTAAELVEAEDDGYYFRTAPSDLLQGAALANIMMRDGLERIVIVARDDAYGRGLQDNARDSLRRFGSPAAAITQLRYAVPGGEGQPIPDLDAVVEQIIAAEPDGVLVIGFSEAAQLIQAMLDSRLPLLE